MGERSAHGRKRSLRSVVRRSVFREEEGSHRRHVGLALERCEKGPESLRADPRVRVENEDVRRGSFAGRLIRRAREAAVVRVGDQSRFGNSRATTSGVPSPDALSTTTMFERRLVRRGERCETAAHEVLPAEGHNCHVDVRGHEILDSSGDVRVRGGARGTLVDSMNAHLGPDAELVVVDNDSSDEPERVARGWKGPGAFLQLDSNHGFGAASNAGVAAATGDAVVLLNPDTELTDDGLALLARVALERRELCGPRIVNPDGSLQASASGPPVGLWPWLRAAVPAGAGPRWAVERLYPSQLETATEVSWLTGCCIAGPRDVLMGLGPFDPAIHMYGEDMDLCIRARIGGVRVAMRPELCQVIHYGKASSERVYGDLGREEAARNGRAVLRRAYGSRREWFAWMAERMSVSARARVKARLGHDASWERLVATGLRRATQVPALPELPLRDPGPPPASSIAHW